MRRKPLTQDQLREKVMRLPLWMQEIACQALDERDDVQRKLEAKTAAQKPTPFFSEHHDVGARGHTKRVVYFDEDREMIVEHNGIRLEINVGRNNMKDGQGIEVKFMRAGDGFRSAGIAIVPRLTGSIEFRKPEDMR